MWGAHLKVDAGGGGAEDPSAEGERWAWSHLDEIKVVSKSRRDGDAKDCAIF